LVNLLLLIKFPRFAQDPIWSNLWSKSESSDFYVNKSTETGSSNLGMLASQASTQGKNQCENQGTAQEASNQEGPHFIMPKDMALTNVFVQVWKKSVLVHPRQASISRRVLTGAIPYV
jgi:hypothetical protein